MATKCPTASISNKKGNMIDFVFLISYITLANFVNCNSPKPSIPSNITVQLIDVFLQ